MGKTKMLLKQSVFGPARQVYRRSALPRSTTNRRAMCSNSLLPLEDRMFVESHTFSSTANWLVPGAILVGRYPFVQKGVEAAAGEADLRKIIDAGVTIFVSLQGELPPQLEMPEEGLLNYQPYASMADELAGQRLTFLHVPIENFSTPGVHMNGFGMSSGWPVWATGPGCVPQGAEGL